MYCVIYYIFLFIIRICVKLKINIYRNKNRWEIHAYYFLRILAVYHLLMNVLIFLYLSDLEIF